MNVIACGPNEIDETCGQAEDMNWYDLMLPIIEQCAKRTAWKYRAYVELDDVMQTGWLYYFENRKTLDAMPRNEPYGAAFLKRRIQSACNTYALKEMCAKTGIQWEDQYRYTTGEVRFLVQLVFAGGLKGGESSDQIAGYVDTKRALEDMPPGEYRLLHEHYGPTDDDPEVLNRLSSTERGRVHRAIRRLQAILNGEEPSESHAEPRSSGG